MIREAATREDELNALITRELELRASGGGSSNPELIRRHPELMPELADELVLIDSIAKALAESSRAGSIEAAEPLSMEELEDPICDTSCFPPPLLQVPGYVVLRRIGAGGQAIVYSAIQQSTGRAVALKVLRGGQSPDERHLARFDRETRILASLDHPSIVDVIDRGRTSDGSLYLAMPFIDGIQIDQRWQELREAHPRDIRPVLKLFVEVCEALEEAHSRQIVHRDLKPSNILVDRRGLPHILDFGLAHEGEADPQISLLGQVIGSLPWTSPEQAAGGEATPQSDVYSLGVMLYEAIATVPPYPTHGARQETLAHVLRSVPTAPSGQVDRRRACWGPLLDDCLLRSLSKHAAARHSSAGMLGQGLTSLLADPHRRSERACRRPLGTLITSLMCLFLVAPTGGPRGADAVLPSYVNSIGMRMIDLPGGRMTMGAAMNAPSRRSNESQRSVRIREMSMAATEVTEHQWQMVMGGRGGGDLPEVNVSFVSACEFCRRLSSIDQRTYRLPSSEEFEWAARCGSNNTTTTLGRDGRHVNLQEVAWTAADSSGHLHHVGTKAPNFWGLFDLMGNAAEWCSDSDDATFAGTPFPADAPEVVRGGCAWDQAEGIRLTAIDHQLARASNPRVGFRVVVERQR